MIVKNQVSDFQPGSIPSLRHMAMSRDIFGCHDLEVMGGCYPHLVSKDALNILHCNNSPPQQKLPEMSIVVRLKNTELDQWFSNLDVHQNHQDGLFEHNF